MSLPIRKMSFLSAILIVINTTFASTEAEVVQDVKEVCTQPATQGIHWMASGSVKGDDGVDVRVLKLDRTFGQLDFTREGWSGIQGVLASSKRQQQLSSLRGSN